MYNYFISALIFFSISLSVYANKSRNTKICGDIFTCASLEENINFWIKVSSDYDSTEGILHNRKTLKIYKKLNTINKQKILKEKRKIVKLNNIDLYSIRFQRGFRDQFIDGINRSIVFKENIEKILKYYEVNKDLFFLTFTESGFNPFALSKIGAKGVWQITKACWKDYLPNDLSFLRTDPIFSSFVSAQFLRDNLKQFNNNYPLAVTSYNYGVKPLSNAITNLRTKNIRIIAKIFNDENLGFAVQNFYASFLASRFVGKRLLKNYAISKNSKFIYVVSPLKITNYANNINLNINPVISSLKYIPEYYPIRVYKGKELQLIKFLKEKFAKILDLKINKERLINKNQICAKSVINYKIQKGDNLLYLAKKFKIKLSNLMKNNKIKKANKIYIGQKLKINITQCKTVKSYATKQPDSTKDIKNFVDFNFGQIIEDTKSWKYLYNLLIKNGDNIYFIYKAKKNLELRLYNKNNISIYPSPLLPNISSRNICKLKEDKSTLEIFSVYFYNKFQKRGLVYLAPWEDLKEISKFLKYDIYREAHIPVWTKSLKYKGLFVDFKNITPQEFIKSRRKYYLNLINKYSKKYAITGLSLEKFDKKQKKIYPSYILYKYNTDLLFKDFNILKELCLPILQVQGEIL